MAKKLTRKIVLTAIGIVWLMTVGLGIRMLWNYASSEGEAANPPAHWPAHCRIQPAADRATLILLAHPHCPCSRATIGELALLMAQCQGRVTAYVAFYEPAGAAKDWIRTGLWDSAAEIPGVSVLSDEDGALAAQFKASTSGQAVLYDSHGELLFAGGITAARGHSGDNFGRTAIVSLLTEQTTQRVGEQVGTPVYGCPLFDRHIECNEEVQKCTR
jgi:hypothetical protein